MWENQKPDISVKAYAPILGANSDRRLPIEARNELREILARNAGERAAYELTDEEVDHFGYFLLTANSVILRHKARTAL